MLFTSKRLGAGGNPGPFFFANDCKIVLANGFLPTTLGSMNSNELLPIGTTITFTTPDNRTLSGKITGRNFSFATFLHYTVTDEEGFTRNVRSDMQSGWAG